MLEALQAGGVGEKAEALKAAAGLDGTPNETYSRQIAMIMRCTVDPLLNREEVLWLGRHFPLVFRWLVRQITNLADGGANLGKPPDSGPIPDLEPA